MQPLGDWIVDSIHTQRQQHFCYWAPHYLWIRVQTGYLRCDPIADQLFQETDIVYQWYHLPADATPMEAVMVTPGCWKWTDATYVLTINIPTIGTFTDLVNSLPPWERELLIHTTMATDAYAVGVALEHGI